MCLPVHAVGPLIFNLVHPGCRESGRITRIDIQPTAILSWDAAYVEPVVAALNLIVRLFRVRKILFYVALKASIELDALVIQKKLLPRHRAPRLVDVAPLPE